MRIVLLLFVLAFLCSCKSSKKLVYAESISKAQQIRVYEDMHGQRDTFLVITTREGMIFMKK